VDDDVVVDAAVWRSFPRVVVAVEVIGFDGDAEGAEGVNWKCYCISPSPPGKAAVESGNVKW